jgi:hypothetical protein
MHLIVHIFKKDVSRLWWGIGVALALQIAVAYMAAVGNPEAPEFSLLLIITWAFLIAVTVHEDPLVGDRQFWITRPSPWPILLGSKLLFAVAVVHVPCFLADSVVLAVRGFHPWEWLGTLLLRQIAIALALTLPVIALAAALQSLAHVALSVIAVGGLTGVASTFLPLAHTRWRGEQDIRVILFFAVLGAAAAAIVLLQYARRRAWQAHIIGVAAVVAAELVLWSLPTVFFGRVRAAFEPARANIAFHQRTVPDRLYSADQLFGYRYVPSGWFELRLPLGVKGIPQGVGSLYDIPALELTAPGNRHYTLHPSYFGPDGLIVQIPQQVYESLKNVDINLKGAVIVILHRDGPTTSLPVGARQSVAGAGRCGSSIVDRTLFDNPAARLPGTRFRAVMVSCASPAGFPLEPTAMLGQPGDTNAAHESLHASSSPWVSLSPIERVHGSFRVPQDSPELATAKLQITPDLSLGWQVVNLDLRGIRLSGYAH